MTILLQLLCLFSFPVSCHAVPGQLYPDPAEHLVLLDLLHPGRGRQGGGLLHPGGGGGVPGGGHGWWWWDSRTTFTTTILADSSEADN